MKCLIDCGTHTGDGLREMNKLFNVINNQDWEIYTFEPNPEINVKYLLGYISNINIINKAIWKKDGEIQFRVEGFETQEEYTSCASKIEEINKTCNPNGMKHYFVNTQCIDFSNFLSSIKDKYEKIIVKMDIEGAEIEVLQHCIDNNTLNMIDELYVEMHQRFNYLRSELHSKRQEILDKEMEYINLYKKYVKKVVKWD